jgi:hypothetical protein
MGSTNPTGLLLAGPHCISHRARQSLSPVPPLSLTDISQGPYQGGSCVPHPELGQVSLLLKPGIHLPERAPWGGELVPLLLEPAGPWRPGHSGDLNNATKEEVALACSGASSHFNWNYF